MKRMHTENLKKAEYHLFCYWSLSLFNHFTSIIVSLSSSSFGPSFLFLPLKKKNSNNFMTLDVITMNRHMFDVIIVQVSNICTSVLLKQTEQIRHNDDNSEQLSHCFVFRNKTLNKIFQT